MDEELEAWRRRRLGTFPYLFLDARYEKARIDGVVRDAAILSAVGIGEDGKRSVLGVSVALSEAEVHWRTFLDSLVARGLRGVHFITSDDHAGLAAARKAVFPGAIWQRCQFHLARNAIHHAPSAATRKAIGRQLRAVWNASDRTTAEAELARIVKGYADSAPKLAAWLEQNVPEGLAVFSLPETHWRRMRTANPIERAIQQELKRRTRKIRVFPNQDALERLATAILVEAALSFLGFGIQPPFPALGKLISDGQDALTTQWWLAVFPGLTIVAIALCINFIGDGLRDALDPKMLE